MKNILRTSLYLTVFALAGILFQISCSNSDNQNLSTNSTPLGKLIYTKKLNGQPNFYIYTCDYDGTNETVINVTLPSGVDISFDSFDLTQLRISPDGQKIFFIVGNSTSGNKSLYSCDITGANPIEVKLLNNMNFHLGGAY